MYLRSLLGEFSVLAPDHEFVLFTPSWADPILEPIPPNIAIVRLLGVPMQPPLRVLYQQSVVPAAVNRHRLDVFLATATVAPLLLRMPVVLVVQFMQFYEIPQAYGLVRRFYLRTMLPLSLKKAAKVLIFTEHSKSDLIRWTGVPVEKVYTVPHGISREVWRVSETGETAPERQVGAQLTRGRPYLVYVSATYGYKNHVRLIRSFGILKRRTDLPHVLLLVGAEMEIPFKYLQSVAEAAGVQGDVIFAGRLDHELAVATYLGADLAVIPTLYETFGFPVLEAMACGCPVVTSGIGSMAELSGDAAVLVDPFDEESISDGMERVLSDTSLRRDLIRRGRAKAREFTWKRSAAHTLEILREAARE